MVNTCEYVMTIITLQRVNLDTVAGNITMVITLSSLASVHKTATYFTMHVVQKKTFLTNSPSCLYALQWISYNVVMQSY